MDGSRARANSSPCRRRRLQGGRAGDCRSWRRTRRKPAPCAWRMDGSRWMRSGGRRSTMSGRAATASRAARTSRSSAVQDGKLAAQSIDQLPEIGQGDSHESKPGHGKDAVDLASEFLGIRSPNPFWLASAPPTDKAYNVNRAFEAGWGGVVWKTLGEDPPIVNVSGPRYGAIHSNDRRVIGFNNVELITDRPLETNLKEIRQVKRDWPDRALVVSVMLPMKREAWAKYVPMIEDTGADALELNFGCPHGMSERGMGSAVGQVPEYIQQTAEWCKSVARDAGHRQADAERDEHPRPGEGGEGGRRGRGIADQHAEFDHARRLRHADDVSGDGWQGLSRRILRPRGQADRAPHGRRDRAQSRDQGAADLRHRRRYRLAGCRRFPRARREQRAGLHGRDGLWLQDHRRPDERPVAFPARQGHERASPSSSAAPCLR